MKREKRYYGGWGKSGRSMQGDRFWRLRAPDALPGSIMMPYRGSRWFRHSNCEDTKRDGDQTQDGESHKHVHANAGTHIHLHVQSPCLKEPTQNQPNTLYLVLLVYVFQRRLSEPTFVCVKQELNKVEHASVSPFVVKMYIT